MQISDSQTSPAEIGLTSGITELLSACSSAISNGDPAAAALLVRLAETKYPNEPLLAKAIAKCKVIVSRSQWLDSALDAMLRDFEEDRYVGALGHFREALGLSRGLPRLRARVDNEAARQAEELLPQNWRIAQTILQEAANAEPALTPEPELLEALKQARYDELVSATIHKSDRLEMEGKSAEAREVLTDFLFHHPAETRIKERIGALDKPELVVKLPATEIAAVPTPSPDYSDLDTEGTPTEPYSASLHPWRARIKISNAAWNAIKNISALGSTAVMLGTAVFLVWHHVSAPAPHPHIQGPTTAVGASPAPIKPVSNVSNAIFEDVPIPPSDQDSMLQAVRLYNDKNGKPIGDRHLDEVAIRGNEGSVRYRSKDTLVFTLGRKNGAWTVTSVH